MNTTVIDLDILELGEGENPFDTLASKIEELTLKGAKAEDVEKAEQTLLFIERQFQDCKI